TFAYRPASYDGWVDVRGSGILDKQSFLAGRLTGRDTPAAVADPTDRGDGGQISLVPFIIGLAAIMLVGLGWSLWRSRSAQ
ncbi:MAG TPA: hypothetical protein VGC59_03170, partial [Solirubrobacteraceae bacterium]